MIPRHPRIPERIYRDLTDEAKQFFYDLIAKLENQLRSPTNPQNSSIPPSTQHPHAKAKPKPKPGKKKQGGQPGHKRATRELVPTEECTDVHPLLPSTCRRCQQPLTGSDDQPLRHQVYEIPEIKPIITEYQLHRLTCECCGTQTCAELPQGVPQSQCGPQLAAFLAMFMVHNRQSKRLAAGFVRRVLKIPCSTGWVCKIQNTVSQALAEPWEDLQRQLESQKQLYVDESPTKQKQSKAWLWVAVAARFAVFGIFLSRKRKSLKALIGDYSGTIINCDRAKMYHDGKTLQWCWAHLTRDIQKLIDSPDRQVRRLGHDLMRQKKLLFEAWHQYQDAKIGWATFRKRTRTISKQFNAYLLRGVFSRNPQLVGMCDELYRHRDWLWTFTRTRGIEPTNNSAERALRPAVIYRKLSHGTQSASGSRFVERMLTVIETCRIQQRSTMEYLEAAVKAYYLHQPPPTLLPTPTMKPRKAA